MKALVTGANGFAGHYLVQHLLSQGDQVLGGVVTEVTPDFPCQTVAMDVQNLEQCREVVATYDPEVIYHLAGMAFAPRAESDFNAALLLNVGGVHNVLRAAEVLGRPTKVLIVSSAEVYGRVSPADLPLTENCAVRPAHNYSLSKLLAETVAQRFAQYGHVDPIIVRPFNHIGPGQSRDFVVSSFAYQLAQIQLGKQDAVIEVGNLEAKRDFTDVRDIVRAYRLALTKGRGIYNLGSGKSIAIQQILDMLIEISGLKVTVKPDPSRMRRAEVPEVYGSYDRAQSELGWEPQLPLRDTLRSVYEYWVRQG